MALGADEETGKFAILKQLNEVLQLRENFVLSQHHRFQRVFSASGLNHTIISI